MRPEDLLSRSSLVAAVAAELERLPHPPAEQVEALRRKLGLTEQAIAGVEWPPLLQALRLKRDTRYADAPTSHRPWIGPLLVLSKRAFRLAFQPFINEMLRRQVEFNEALFETLAALYEQQQESARAHAFWRRSIEERLRKLEQHLQSATEPPTPPRE